MSTPRPFDTSQRHEHQITDTIQETERIRALFWSPGEATWQFATNGYQPAREGQVEAEFSIGNGLFGARASFEFPTPVSQPRTYIAGLFGQPPGPLQAPILLSAPDWLCLYLMVDGQPVTPTTGETLEEERLLDARRAILVHRLRWRCPSGAILQLRTARLASQAQRALGVLHAHLRVEQPALLSLEIRTHQSPALPLDFIEHDGAVAVWHTPRRGHWLAIGHDAALQVGGQVQRPIITTDGMRWQWQALPDEHAIFTRFAVFSRGDGGQATQRATIATCRAVVTTARRDVLQRGTLALAEDHIRAWQQRWEASDVIIEDDRACQQALRFSVYHLLSAANPDDPHVSIGARGLTGDAYYGHVFWDTDIFTLPFFLYTWPEAARAMLLYRHRTLAAARGKATRLGYRGAFFAWESADTGEEATPRGVLGPDGREVVYSTATQAAHISADVAYAAWHYWHVTADDAFMRDAGVELLIETARFWASRATRGPETPNAPATPNGRYHIRQVTGPDEYHDGVDDNAYTNLLARWNLARAGEMSAWLCQHWPEHWATLRARLSLTDDELATWRDVAAHLVTGYDPETGLFEQFAGFSRLEYLDLATFTPRSPTMDLVLGHERIRQTQVIKQPDVVMLLALLWDQIPPQARAANFQYYAPRCSHGSSLSLGIHALVAARLGDVSAAERYFRRAAEIDEQDIRRDAAAGVHIATQGSIWQAAVLGFAGLHTSSGRGPAIGHEPSTNSDPSSDSGFSTDDGLHLDPHLPASWRELGFAAHWRGRRVRVALRNQDHTLTATLEHGPALPLTLGDQRATLQLGTPWTAQW